MCTSPLDSPHYPGDSLDSDIAPSNFNKLIATAIYIIKPCSIQTRVEDTMHTIMQVYSQDTRSKGAHVYDKQVVSYSSRSARLYAKTYTVLAC